MGWISTFPIVWLAQWKCEAMWTLVWEGRKYSRPYCVVYTVGTVWALVCVTAGAGMWKCQGRGRYVKVPGPARGRGGEARPGPFNRQGRCYLAIQQTKQSTGGAANLLEESRLLILLQKQTINLINSFSVGSKFLSSLPLQYWNNKYKMILKS